MLQNILSADELEDLYYSYPTDMDIYQGLSTTDMKRLQNEHVQPQKGKIYIPSGKIGGRISTTEKYVQENLQQLQQVINQYHPLS